jgi:hypothetical protein
MDAVDGISSIEKAEACFAKLQAGGVKFERIEQPATETGACFVETPVKLFSASADKTKITFPDKPLLACGFAGQFAQFMVEVANPLAFTALASAIKTIETGPGHECRFRNRALSGKMSEHGHGLAVDIRALTLTDGRRLVVGAATAESEKHYLETLGKAACGFFSTVLGPGGDAMHKDHLHLDAEVRQTRMGAHFCQP